MVYDIVDKIIMIFPVCMFIGSNQVLEVDIERVRILSELVDNFDALHVREVGERTVLRVCCRSP